MCVFLFFFLFGLENFIILLLILYHLVSLFMFGVGVGVCCLKSIRERSRKNATKKTPRRGSLHLYEPQKAASRSSRGSCAPATLRYVSSFSSSSFRRRRRAFVDGGRSASHHHHHHRHNTKNACLARGGASRNDDEKFGRRRRGGGGGGEGEREQRRRRELRCERENFGSSLVSNDDEDVFIHSEELFLRNGGKSPPRSLQLYEEMVRVGVFGRARDGDEIKAREREEGGNGEDRKRTPIVVVGGGGGRR